LLQTMLAILMRFKKLQV